MDRLPPHSQESEQALLGCLFDFDASPEIIDAVIDLVPTEAFYDLKHQVIYRTLIALHSQGAPLQIAAVQAHLSALNQIESVGGLSYLASLPELTPSPRNADYYAKIVMEHFTRRRVIQAATAMVDMAFNDGTITTDELMGECEARLSEISNARESQDQKPIKELVQGAINTIETWHENHGIIPGISTGFVDLDNMTMGMQSGDMIVVAGRPSMGKTSLALNILEHVSVDLGFPSGMFSLEMRSAQLAMRMLCSKARVVMKNIQEGFLAERDFPKLTGAAGKISHSKLFIDDTPGLTMLQIRSRARAWSKKHSIKFLVIDYIQLIHPARKRSNRQEEVSEISSGVKELARDLDIPVMVLCQLNREIEKEKNRKPRLSDLRESGAIEQDADLIGILYSDGENDDPESECFPVGLNIAKQRNGPTGILHLTFLKNLTRFESASRVADEDFPIRQDRGIR